MMKLYIYKLINSNTKTPELVKEVCEAEPKAKTYQIIGDKPEYYDSNRVFKSTIGKAGCDGTVVILTEDSLITAKSAFREYYKNIIHMHQSVIDTAQRKINVIENTEDL